MNKSSRLAPKRKPESGCILVSEPFLDDDFFSRSVVLLARSEESGTMGFILNKPLNNTVDELIDNFPFFDSPVYYGGPVENNSLFFVHVVPDLIGSSFEIGGGLHFGGDFEKLQNLIVADLIKPNQIRFFAGYSGWDEGQLDHEISEHSWLVFEMPENLMETDPLALWKELIRNTNSEMAIWANFPDDPKEN